MAIKPQDADTFLKEVDEELRKERLNQFVARYGWWILAAVVLVLGAIGGALWWNNRQEAKAAEHGATTVHLETNRALPEAIALYRKEGYREVSPFNGEPYADHWFEKTLER